MTTLTKYYNLDDTCKKLKISRQTLNNWYRWENNLLKEGIITKRTLPVPVHDNNMRGKPRYWTQNDIDILKKFRDSMVVGRNGIYGKYTNPNYKVVDNK